MCVCCVYVCLFYLAIHPVVGCVKVWDPSQQDPVVRWLLTLSAADCVKHYLASDIDIDVRLAPADEPGALR